MATLKRRGSDDCAMEDHRGERVLLIGANRRLPVHHSDRALSASLYGERVWG